jgi:hypothetical protein
VSLDEIPRQDLADQLLAGAEGEKPLLLTGPPGAGKTSLLLAAAAGLKRRGWVAVYLDLMAAAAAPEHFVASALRALPADRFADRLEDAAELRRLASAGRSHGAAAVRGLLSLWASLTHASGQPVALLLDEVTEIKSLAYFPDLRQIADHLGSALGSRPRGTLLTTSLPRLAGKLWPEIETVAAEPFRAEDLAGEAGQLGVDPGQLHRASFGWPRYVRILLEAARDGEDAGSLARVWAREMAPGGRLEACARHTYEALLLRSRGYGMSKAVMAAVAREEGLNLTALVQRLGRSPGAVRDYLGWLLGVDALRTVKKRYYYVDQMVRLWVRLHAQGTPPSAGEILEVAETLVGDVTGRRNGVETAPRTPSHDSLMEID